MAYACKVLADSIAEHGSRLTTFEITFPRIVLAELNTHRMLSRNSASSRAVPVARMIQRVRDDPFVPEEFGSEKRGMQAGDPVAEHEAELARDVWLEACGDMVAFAEEIAELGVHKQLANRLLEPFLWHTAVVSATEWSNFFALRCSPEAQPQLRTIAEMMRDEMDRSEPVLRLRWPKSSQAWHLPYVEDWERHAHTTETLKALSAGRCARVSTLTHDGRRSVQADLNLRNRLAGPGHWSPFEHQAYPAAYEVPIGNFVGWVQQRKLFAWEADAGSEEAREMKAEYERSVS